MKKLIQMLPAGRDPPKIGETDLLGLKDPIGLESKKSYRVWKTQQDKSKKHYL